jgi:hypothetical protein
VAPDGHAQRVERPERESPRVDPPSSRSTWRYVFLEGWFEDTLPKVPIERLAVLHMDGDLYESTMDGLNALYEKVSPGGYVIVDD